MGGRLLFLLFFLSLSTALAQKPSYDFKNITINEGLSQNSVVAIAEDDYGFMWFATQDGLNRFDGRDFVIFPRTFDDITSPTNSQTGKLVARGKELWLIKKGGEIEIFDLATEEFRPFLFPEKQENLQSPVTYLYFDTRDDLWLGTSGMGLYKIDRKTNKVTRYHRDATNQFSLSGNRVRSVFQDSSGDIWIMTYKGLNRLGKAGNRQYLPGVNANILKEDKDGKLWLGTFGKGIFTRAKDSATFSPFQGYPKYPIPKDLIVESLLTEEDGKVWVGTYGNGLFIINTNEETIVHLLPERRNPFSLGFQDVLSIEKDRNGGIWIGTDGGGVSYYNLHFNIFNRLTDQDVQENIAIEQIRAVTTDDDGFVWLGTSGNGLTSFLPAENEFQTFHFKPFKSGISNYDRVVSLLSDDEGDLWIGTQGNGLMLKDRGTGELKKWFFSEAGTASERIPDNTIWTLTHAENNRVWAGTRNAGLLLIDKEKGLISQYLPEPASNLGSQNNIRSVEQLNDSILALGLEQNGIRLLNTCTGKFKEVTNLFIEQTIEDEYGIKCLFFESGFLWAGTAGRGILIIHLESGNTQLLDASEDLPNNMIYGILPEGKNAVWVSSNRGIFRIDHHVEMDEVQVTGIYPFTVEDGLQSNEFNTGAFHKAKDGTLYFGGINGLNFFNPNKISHSRRTGPVVLTGVMVGNKPLETDTLITYKDHIRLPYSENSLSFNYTVLDFLSPQKMNYQYRLTGYDDNWIDAGSRQYSAYTNLPPGEYDFQVKLAGEELAEAQTASLGITITGPFWLRWWFIVMVILIIATLLYAFYRYRINQLLEVQRVKNTISADLHDDLGSRLTSIHFLSAVSKKKILMNEDAKACLQRIDEEVMASAEALNEIVWNIKMNDESLEDIVAKMRRYAGEALDGAGLNYKVTIEDDFTGKKMGMQERRELFLIYKELLNNIRKHAAAETVDIEIAIKEEMFYLAVGDDGKGFNPDGETDRNGIRNSRERVRKWNGRLKITSESNKGTLIEIWLPFDSPSLQNKFLMMFKKDSE